MGHKRNKENLTKDINEWFATEEKIKLNASTDRQHAKYRNCQSSTAHIGRTVSGN